jgi:hypothetical protein
MFDFIERENGWVIFRGRARAPSAVLHVARRQRCHAEGVVVLEVDVPRRWLRRSKRGLYYSLHDLPPERIRGVVTFAALASTPVQEPAA